MDVILLDEVAKLKNDVASLATLINMGTVKSVQRGTTTHDYVVMAVNISSVNPDKCLVLLNSKFSSNISSNVYNPMLVSLTDTTLTYNAGYCNSNGRYYPSDTNWQVIEFY